MMPSPKSHPRRVPTWLHKSWMQELWTQEPIVREFVSATRRFGKRVWQLKRKNRRLKRKVRRLERQLVLCTWAAAVERWVSSLQPFESTDGDEFMPGTTNITVDGAPNQGAIYVKKISGQKYDESWAAINKTDLTGPVGEYIYSGHSAGSTEFDTFVTNHQSGYRADTSIEYCTPPSSAAGLPVPPSGSIADRYTIYCKATNSYVEKGELYRVRLSADLVHEHWRMWTGYEPPNDQGSKVKLKFVKTETPDLDGFLQRSQSKGGSYVFAKLYIKPIT